MKQVTSLLRRGRSTLKTTPAQNLNCLFPVRLYFMGHRDPLT